MIPSRSAPLPRLNASHWLLLLVLAAIQLTHILDFMLLMPLAPYLQKDLGIAADASFGVLVSAYGFAACLAGLLLAPWLDRFDRKSTLLTLFAGFTLGTLLCALASSYALILLGRIVAGAFGGVVGAVVLTIVGDAFPLERRATATGAVMSAFSLASIAGIPLALLLAGISDYGWRAPFAVLAGLSAGLFVLTWWVMPSIAGHLSEPSRPGQLWEVISRPAHLRAYLLMLALVFSGFTIFPYFAAFLTKNVGRSSEELPLIYLVGGCATLISMNVIGRIADRFPRRLVFRVFALATVFPMVGMTLLPPGASLALTLTVTTSLMIFSSGRMVPAMAMITSTVEPRIRGSFLSINSSVQQFSAGLAPLVGGMLLTDPGPGQPLVGYPLAGLLAGGMALLSVVLGGLLRAPSAQEGLAPTLPETAGAA